MIHVERYRAYIYRIATAVAAVAVGYGILTDDKATLWLGVINAAVGGLASVFTSTRES